MKNAAIHFTNTPITYGRSTRMASNISIISHLNNHSNGPVNADGDPVFFRQGDLDGACAAYATLTALVTLGVISRDDVKVLGPLDGRTKLGKLFSWFHSPQALLRDGMDYGMLWTALEDAYGRDLSIDQCQDTGARAREFILKALSNDQVVIVSYGGNGWAHASVAVGTEEHDDGINLLLLDPGFKKPKYCCWNNVLSLTPEPGRYPYRCWRGEAEYVSLYDAIAVGAGPILTKCTV